MICITVTMSALPICSLKFLPLVSYLVGVPTFRYVPVPKVTSAKPETALVVVLMDSKPPEPSTVKVSVPLLVLLMPVAVLVILSPILFVPFRFIVRSPILLSIPPVVITALLRNNMFLLSLASLAGVNATLPSPRMFAAFSLVTATPATVIP